MNLESLIPHFPLQASMGVIRVKQSGLWNSQNDNQREEGTDRQTEIERGMGQQEADRRTICFPSWVISPGGCVSMVVGH